MTLKTARLNMRVRPETKEQLEEEARAIGVSTAALARMKLRCELPSVLSALHEANQQPIGGGGGRVGKS